MYYTQLVYVKGKKEKPETYFTMVLEDKETYDDREFPP